MNTTTDITAGKPSNYFVRHWRGELPLGTSYWVNGVLLGNVLPLAVVIAARALDSSESGNLRLTSAASLVAMVLSLLAFAWGSVGIWRSARHHVERGGGSGWATAAKTMVLISVLSVLGPLVNSNVVEQMKEHWKIATGHDPVGRVTATVSPDGQSVMLQGAMGEGSGADVKRVLKANTGIKVVELQSQGGRLHEARIIANEVRTRGLNTYVEGMCASACTMVFLAGRDRGATPNARIGFHRPSFAGRDDGGSLSGGEQMMSSYRTAGISDAFIARVRQTGSESMWYPTRDELIANHVITRVSLGGETANGFNVHSIDDVRAAFKSVPLWTTVDKRFPGTMERAVKLAWDARQRGVPNEQVMSAARSVLAELMPKALSTARDEQLEAFLVLTRTELAESYAVSAQACSKLLAGQLNIAATLPKAVIEQELSFMDKLFSTPPRADLTPPPRRDAGEAMRMALAKLTPRQVEIVGAIDKYSGEPELQCKTLMAFYDEVAKLAPRPRGLVLRAMYQMER